MNENVLKGLKLKTQIIITLATCLIFGCVAQKSFDNKGKLKGTVGKYIGNCMPAPNNPPCEPEPLSTFVIITSPTKTFDKRLVIDSVKSDESGLFEIVLAEGMYSLFLKDDKEYICTGIKCPEECICMPIEIVGGTETSIKLNLDRATW